jgi:hypothetical protein
MFFCYYWLFDNKRGYQKKDNTEQDDIPWQYIFNQKALANRLVWII